MRFYPIKTPKIVQQSFPHYQWSGNRNSKSLYLTFDDGPTESLNPFIVDALKERNSSATFFCVGENLRKNNNELKRLTEGQYSLGNHTFNHLNGWKTSLKTYCENADKCRDEFIENGIETNLFRPPYGRITKKQSAKLISKGYKIIMWDVLSGDFDPSMNPDKCLSKVIKHSNNGSIIVFHDNVKAESTLKYVLPRFMDHMISKGFQFESL